MKKMKKILFTLVIGIMIASCNNQGNNAQLEMDLNSEKLIKTNKKGFKFDKKNNYTSSNKKSKSKSAETHPGCTSECCSNK